MSDDHVVLIASLGALLLFCDAPFIDSEQPYIVLRSGRKKWVAGQIAYIAISSALFTLFLYLLTLLLLLPWLEFSTEWGKAIGTLAQTTTGYDLGITITFDRYIFSAIPRFQRHCFRSCCASPSYSSWACSCSTSICASTEWSVRLQAHF